MIVKSTKLQKRERKRKLIENLKVKIKQFRNQYQNNHQPKAYNHLTLPKIPKVIRVKSTPNTDPDNSNSQKAQKTKKSNKTKMTDDFLDDFQDDFDFDDEKFLNEV